MKKVIVGMSGGVDSAVTAYLLQLAGYEVIGLTLRSWVFADGQESRCCEIDDAKHVAEKLGIAYYVKNCFSEFQTHVTEPFTRDYCRGLTPNPCIVCNRHVKWEKLLESADVMGAEYVATGHYASVLQLPNGRFSVQSGAHAKKDQAYMLYRLSQQQLARTLMPLGKLSKEEVRDIAEKAQLPVANKADSQEICFVQDNDYAGYIEEYATEEIPGEGNFVDEEGRILGRHKGIIHYTVGQRKGLGLPLGVPAYVKEIRAEENEVVIAGEEALYRKEIFCSDLNFLSIPQLAEGEQLSCHVKIRYHHPGEAAVIQMAGEDLVKITFEKGVRAPAPGQSAVFYDADGIVIGGGVIRGSHDAPE